MEEDRRDQEEGQRGTQTQAEEWDEGPEQNATDPAWVAWIDGAEAENIGNENAERAGKEENKGCHPHA